MAKKKQATTIPELIDQIEQRLEVVEEYVAWSIRADQRFKKGQRVEFSRKAIENRIGPGKKGVTRGVVTGVSDNWSVTVLLDGYKSASSFHHSFFNPVSGAKLF